MWFVSLAFRGAADKMSPPEMDPESGAASAQEISQLLERWASRDPAARDRLVPLVYEELRRLAHRYARQRGLPADGRRRSDAVARSHALLCDGGDVDAPHPRGTCPRAGATETRRRGVDHVARGPRCCRADMPPAKYPRISPTVIRVPRTHGFPNLTAGSMLMRSSRATAPSVVHFNSRPKPATARPRRHRKSRERELRSREAPAGRRGHSAP